MDEKRARALLTEERRRLERLLRSVEADLDRVGPADEVSEDPVDGADRRTFAETDEAVARQLSSRLEALRRAEDRLAAGTYGRSVLSGRPIPDERLEAFPLAELTVDEEAAQARGGRLSDRPDAARIGPSREPFRVFDDPAAQDDQLVEDDETSFDELPPERDPALPEVPDDIPEDDRGRILPLPEVDDDRDQDNEELS
jgi:DnaK suppressor protein